ncbi:hypothetical protein PCC9214_05452 (plasmid) [Planktothrix tepida]|uniref:Uncharacterized protein n=2 Tax=Planktothrix TaxID=54304 RepID=A0A1J1LQW0_9CYAN|nr:hypothetical protein PCC9214_05452 [Planktothrix tepida]CUR33945.1 hypothetical protein PL921460054 [Planktothrix tepida PCC 9214]
MVVVFGLIIMLDNGQWIEVGGIPYFCPDNSPSYDYLWDEDELEESKPDYNTNSQSQTSIDYDEF